MNKLYIVVIIAIIMHIAYSAYAEQEATTTNTPATEINIITMRDPFWPSGWRPPNFGRKKSIEEIKSPIKWDEAASLLRITGLSKKPDGNYIAIIKGYGIVEKGETLTVNYQGLIYTWTIKKITALGIERKKLSVSM